MILKFRKLTKLSANQLQLIRAALKNYMEGMEVYKIEFAFSNGVKKEIDKSLIDSSKLIKRIERELDKLDADYVYKVRRVKKT